MESTDFVIVGLAILVAFVATFVYLARRSARRFETEKHHRRHQGVPYPASTSTKAKGRRRR